MKINKGDEFYNIAYGKPEATLSILMLLRLSKEQKDKILSELGIKFPENLKSLMPSFKRVMENLTAKELKTLLSQLRKDELIAKKIATIRKKVRVWMENVDGDDGLGCG